MTEPRLDGPAVVFELSGAGDVDGAARAAARFRPQVVLDAIDYQDVSEHAERYRDRVLAWPPLVDLLSRPEMAYWYADNSVADLAHLDDQNTAAALLVDSVKASVTRSAEILAMLETVAYGPDAGVSRERVGVARASAEELRAVVARIDDV